MINIFRGTVLNYVLVAVGTFLVSKGWITLDLWEMFRGAFEEAVLVALGGGGVIAIIVGAARGILESQKSKVSIAGQSVPLNSMTPKAQQVIAAEVKREVNLPPKTRRTLEDIVKGQ